MLSSRESPFRLTLALALIHPDKFELVLQKATELGVTHFVPLLTDRTETRPERILGRYERWRKILFEAVKQSGRSIVPVIDPPTTFSEASTATETKFFFDASATAPDPPARVPRAIAFIGPEGGWSENEIMEARESGATFRRLGPRRLRAETAAIAAVTLLAHELGDLG